MPTGYDPRERAAEAARLLNNFLLDFIVGTRGLEIFHSSLISPGVTQPLAVGLNRMAISHLVVTLSKWTEFYQRYRAILPADVRDQCRALNKKIVSRGVVDFRNTVVGHILDRDTKRPLTSEKIDERLGRILAGQRDDFLGWINDPKNNLFQGSVVSITEFVRDRLRVEYQLCDDEIL